MPAPSTRLASSELERLGKERCPERGRAGRISRLEEGAHEDDAQAGLPALELLHRLEAAADWHRQIAQHHRPPVAPRWERRVRHHQLLPVGNLEHPVAVLAQH